jgi:putative transposase
VEKARPLGAPLCLYLGGWRLSPGAHGTWLANVYRERQALTWQCILVLIGATPEGRKELIGFQTGYRESAQSWRELLADLKARGLTVPPELAIGDGALGFWKALEEEFGATRQQRCWVHKTMNVLNKLPKSVQPKAKADLREIWMAQGRVDAEKAFDRFLARYQAKYDKAAACLAKDREALLAFYDFPAEHWKAHPHRQSDREHLRHRPTSHDTRQGLPVARHGHDHGSR